MTVFEDMNMSSIEYIPADDGFINLLQHAIQDGETAEAEADELVRKAVKLLEKHGGSATVTMAVTIKKDPNYTDVYTIAAKPTLKPPKTAKKAALMYANKQHGLISQQPEQGSLLDGN